MRILICNERFLFRFGVDRVLLMLGTFWRESGHEVIMMGNKLDPTAVDKCSDRFIYVPEAPDYLHGNDYTLTYVSEHWDKWFDENNTPDIALIAGWPFYNCVDFLRRKCGYAFFHDYGAVPTEGMSQPQVITQNELRRLRHENLRHANKVIAISSFLEETQSKKDVEGLIPTSYVHLGIDHLNMKLWSQDELNIEQNDVVKDIEAFKAEGYRIIFQPGRWETGNYKNSDGSFELARALKKKNIKAKILVLSTPENMGGIPEDMVDTYYCLGFIDDATMRKAMELSDLGLSPTTWEGFDLPLGEMQFLNKCMYVLDIGAHPEVVADPYFLCKDMKEMADKIVTELEGKLPFTKEQVAQMHEKFRQKFTWKHCADEMLRQMEEILVDNTVLFIDTTNACHDTANSGVMRVTRKIAHYMQHRMKTIYLLWDKSIGQYVFPYPAEVQLLCSYGGPLPEEITYLSEDGKPRMTLDDALEQIGNCRKYLLFTETVEAASMEQATDYLHERKIAVSAIFHDAIPVLRPELCSKQVADNHKLYMLALGNIDLALATAGHNQQDLEDFWKQEGLTGHAGTAGLAAELDSMPRETRKINRREQAVSEVLFVSTLEPRKNHMRFLQAWEKMLQEHPEMEKKAKLTLVGNRYAGNTEIPAFVEDFCKQHANVNWLGVVDDEKLRSLYQSCTFTAYPSEIEGFGMPIIESLWSGKPCLCSNSGSVGELAAAGGCMATDVFSVDAIAENLYKMLSDDALLVALQNAATDRKITTWNAYVDSIKEQLLALSVDFSAYIGHAMPGYLRHMLLKQYGQKQKKQGQQEQQNQQDQQGQQNQQGQQSQDKDRVIILSNFYPPNFVGGAEIIAHNQARTLQEDGLADVLVVSLDLTGSHAPFQYYLEEVEGITVLRMPVPSAYMDTNNISFYHEEMDAFFGELCDLLQPTVIHGHNMVGFSLGMFREAKKRGAKICITLHDNWGFCFRQTVLTPEGEICKHFNDCENCKKALTADGMHLPIEMRQSYFRRQFELVDAFISPSRYLAENYIKAGFSFRKMHVLWNGIRVENFQKIQKKPSEQIRITYVGYFGKHKGIHHLIDAVASLNNPKLFINLVGDGEEREALRQQAIEAGLIDRVRFWGKVDNSEIMKAYEETDIYCLPSIWPENQPVSITEAMACGIPVLASRLGGSKELVLDGETGYLIDAGIADSLAEKIQEFVKHPERIEAFGKAGAAVMASNDYHSQVKKLVELYHSLEEQSADECLRKPVLLVKGKNIPSAVTKLLRGWDVLLLDWASKERDVLQAKACLLMDGEELTEDEELLLSDAGVRVLKQARVTNSAKATEELLALLSRL